MAAAAAAAPPDLFAEQELTCSICLDLFTDPVSTPCGHNFCQACIGGYWASTASCTCPLCKHAFDERPQLSINKVFAVITENYKASRYGAAASAAPANGGNPFASAPGEDAVWCDVCTGAKRPAVSSCLTCTAAYCDEHVLPHRNTPFYAKHPLMDPQQALRGRTCALHRRLLEVFCRTCQRCICAICVLEDHRTHKTVSVQTERLSKQKHVAMTEQQILNRIKDKEMILAELNRKLEGVKTYGERERSEVETLLDDAAASLARLRAQVVGGVELQMGAVLARGEGQASLLESELAHLTDRRAQLEAQAVSQDHIGFLQSFSEATSPLGSDQPVNVEDLDLDLRFGLGRVKAALAEIRDKLEDARSGGGGGGARGSVASVSSGEQTMMTAAESVLSLAGSSGSLRRSQWALRDLKKLKPVSGHKKARAYTEDVTLNPVTAYPFLILSDDRKQVKRGEKLQFYRNSQQRFDVWSCVSGKDGYATGRHYWEVLVGENKDWKLGVASESAQRKGLFDMSPANGYFALWWSGSQLRALTAPPLTKVKAPPKLRQVGVFLDVEAGQVSFYNVKSGSEMFSFHCGEFTEQMFPLLGTGDKEVPLVILS
ncbi:E3 ubiquitin-protein ligase TRIM39 [Syngnathoides biaculeatus]|uniref:E3 ubiquitin-protein ligase TRIM39 n=1 Tax=Syngnathoides biaculeatus TaxID=300417 RepID=UPI002ADD957F|nr:E3 ubiquitin-protein ligase TRIM39 [Syngnathoides biaculeatus]XP_061701300.1 E3 ubiquitin-protein ligase TRIM39 [Syngnathoides biaculeatus]